MDEHDDSMESYVETDTEECDICRSIHRHRDLRNCLDCGTLCCTGCLNKSIESGQFIGYICDECKENDE